jgi:hypothetical protein
MKIAANIFHIIITLYFSLGNPAEINKRILIEPNKGVEHATEYWNSLNHGIFLYAAWCLSLLSMAFIRPSSKISCRLVHLLAIFLFLIAGLWRFFEGQFLMDELYGGAMCFLATIAVMILSIFTSQIKNDYKIIATLILMNFSNLVGSLS